MILPRISWFMIVFGTPITFILLMNYVQFAANPKVPQFVFFGCLMECISTGIFGGCLTALAFHRIFKFELGVSWSDICLIRIFSSSPILVIHPISLWFIDWKSLPALSMTVAWLIAAIDFKINWNLFAHPEIQNSSEPAQDQN